MHTDAWPSKQEKEGKKKHTILAVLKTPLKKIFNGTFRKKIWDYLYDTEVGRLV